MKTKSFFDTKGLELIIKSRKSAVMFYMTAEQLPNRFVTQFNFSTEVFLELFQYLNEVAHECWTNFVPKEAYSMGSDYDEYYDKEFDCNGYCKIGRNILLLDRPNEKSTKQYQFNKQKMQSFMYDFDKILKGPRMVK